jgi:signal transduction histidine kinase
MVTTFFQINRDIFFFLYGLVFFIMGIAILLQTRHASRLDLARSLVWLALFGILHGLNEWGDFFIPKQAAYLSVSTINFLYAFQLLILAVSFACLFEFGVTLLNPLGLAPWTHGLAAVLFLLWGIVVFLILTPFGFEMTVWRSTSNALARYFICLPAGLIAAYGLRLQTNLRIAPLKVPSIATNLRIAGISIAIYGLLAGAIPPVIPFFPGNLINVHTIGNLVGIPVWVFRSVVALVMTITVIKGLEIFELETQRRIEELEQQQIVTSERERLARDLHDGAIQKVYTAGLLVESASKLAPIESEISIRIQKAVVVLNDAIADLRLNLAELHSSAPTVEVQPLGKLLSAVSSDPRYTSMVMVGLEMDIPAEATLAHLRSNHLLAIVNEAFSNVIRHSGARNVMMRVRSVDDKLLITIKDDGKGMPAQQTGGYGLRNMRDRAHLLDGRINFSSQPGKGTTVTLEIPWVDA